MRTIKFRAWDKDNTIMICAGKYNDEYISFEGRAVDVDMFSSGIHTLNYDLMQFTGLSDKNGVEIYEGDYFKNTETGSVFEVYYGENSACYRAKRQDGWHFDLQQLYPIDNWEVIGNIYEKEAADE